MPKPTQSVRRKAPQTAAELAVRTGVGLEARVRRLWREWRRWHEADKLGWATAGKVLLYTSKDTEGFAAQWAVRNANRIYRLTRDRRHRRKLLGA